MFMLIGEMNSYEYSETSDVYHSYEAFIEAGEKLIKSDMFVAAYKVERQIPVSEISLAAQDRHNRRDKAIRAAKSKLTSDELELLGIR